MKEYIYNKLSKTSDKTRKYIFISIFVGGGALGAACGGRWLLLITVLVGLGLAAFFNMSNAAVPDDEKNDSLLILSLMGCLSLLIAAWIVFLMKVIIFAFL